ncbi:MAG: hypothetical protein ACFFAV_11200 [Candidatus Hermodarchaeota archaeon]
MSENKTSKIRINNIELNGYERFEEFLKNLNKEIKPDDKQKED